MLEVVNEKSYYMRHGQHLNAKCKNYMAKRIATTIKQLLKNEMTPNSEEESKNMEANSPNHQASGSDPKKEVSVISECNSAKTSVIVKQQLYQTSDKVKIDRQNRQTPQEIINSDSKEETQKRSILVKQVHHFLQ